MPKTFFKIIGCSLVLSVGMLGICAFLMDDNKNNQFKKINTKGSEN